MRGTAKSLLLTRIQQRFSVHVNKKHHNPTSHTMPVTQTQHLLIVWSMATPLLTRYTKRKENSISEYE